MKKKRIRDKYIHVMVTEQERQQIHERMDEVGTMNRSAFIRKMILKGYAIYVDIEPVKELISLQRRCVNNLKQISAYANAHGVYIDEISALQKGYDDLWKELSDLLKYIAAMMVL